MAANVALMPSPRQARRSAPRSAMSVAQYGPAMTRERSRMRIPSSIIRVSATVEKALRHCVDLGDARARDGVKPRLGLCERREGLGGQELGVGPHLFEER